MTTVAAAPVPAGVDVLLADGTIGTVRRVESSDRDALVALHERLADDNLRFRFFGLNRGAGLQYAEHLAATAGSGQVLGLVAVVAGEVVAVASAEVESEDSAEVSFLVADPAHGLGIGTLLLEHIAAEARDRGISEFTADVLADNEAMLRVLIDCGFDVERRTEHGVVTFHMGTAATARAVAAADAREAQAEARSLAPLLYPRSVAIVGVRADGGGVGRAVLDELRLGGYTGDVHVVHPGPLEIPGERVVPRFAAIGGRVDLVMVAVPAGRVLDVVREAAEAGARAAVILSSGFSEAGPEGAASQRALVEVARAHSMRLVGPNCLGVMSTAPEVRLNATFTHGLPGPGGLAVASQSGGVGIRLLDLAQESGAGLASFVSLGNKADVSGNDLLAAWLDDPHVAAAALYLESFGNARKFARIARRFAERKPLLAVVGGRSTGGRRAGSSHTAAAAAPTVGVDALFAQTGVIGCRSLDELADTARLLTTQALPGGPRVAVVGNAGGLGVLAADSATADGLVVPELSAELQEQLSTHASGAAALANPIDLGAAASAATLLATTRAALASDEVDAVLLIVAATKVTDADGFLQDLARSRTGPEEKPLLLVALGGATVPERSAPAFAQFRSVETATRALAHAATYAAWRATPPAPVEPAPPGPARVARPIVDAALSSLGPDGGWVSAHVARDLLAAYGVELVDGRVERGLPDILAAAHEVGYPVVLKAADPNLVHKTDRGLVRSGLASPEDVVEAAQDLAARLDTPDPALLVQAQVPAGVETAVGVVRDDSFGPLVMVAAGGVATDVWDDRVFLLPPLAAADAARAVRRLRIWPILAGYRGEKPVDVPALEALVRAVGQLALDVPELAEMDLNPVIMGPEGAACVDVKLRLGPAPAARDDGVPRKLRPTT